MKRSAESLAAAGHNIFIVTPKVYKKSKHYEDYGKIKVYRFPFFAGDRLLDTYDSVPCVKMFFYFLSGLLTTLKVIIGNKCNILHSHFVLPTGLMGVIVAHLIKIRHIVTIYGTDIAWFSWSKTSIMRAVIKCTLRHADQLIAISPFARDIALSFISSYREVSVSASKSKGIGFGKNQARSDKDNFAIPVIGVGGLNSDTLSRIPARREARRELSLDEKTFVVLFIGQLSRRKRVCDLIQAFSTDSENLKPVKLIIIGKGEELENLREQVQSLRVTQQIKFLDYVPSVFIYMAAADLFVLPSEAEGLGIVTMEAMASGCPVLASRTTATKNLINDGLDGFLFTMGDVNELAEKIKELYENSPLRERVALAGREKALKEYREEVQTDRILKIYNQLVPN